MSDRSATATAALAILAAASLAVGCSSAVPTLMIGTLGDGSSGHTGGATASASDAAGRDAAGDAPANAARADANADANADAAGPLLASCTVRDFGAMGDGGTFDTVAVQTAIDRCDKVTVPAGTYLVGPLFLRSNLTLELEAGALLQATDDLAVFVAASSRTGGAVPSIINGTSVDHLTITGSGAIDGAGATWWAKIRAASEAGADEPWRPLMIDLVKPTNLLIENVTLRNSPKFHIWAEFGTNLEFKNITISSPGNSPNTDGIDPKSSHHVTITGCNISTGDDNVAITSGGTDASDILVSNCTFGAGHGVSIGSYANGGVSQMTVQHCSFTGTQQGIRIKTSRDRGGDIHDLVYDDLQMTGVTNAIYFTDYYPKIPAPGTDMAVAVTPTTTNLHQVTISNVTATGGRRAGYLIGLPEMPIANLQLTNVNISATTGLEVRNALGIHFSGSSLTSTSGPPLILEENTMVDGMLMLDAGAAIDARANGDAGTAGDASATGDASTGD